MPVDGALNAPGLIAEVTNTVLFHATGDDHPRPFTSTPHRMFSVADQVVGSLPSLKAPAPPGPRNCGHAIGGSAAITRATESTDSTETRATESTDDTENPKAVRSRRMIG